MDNNSRISKFSSTLLHWHEHENFRSYPWRGEKNPYYIWLSEIIMQQTRSEQGLPYYLKFKTHYPTVRDLALAPMDTVLRDWQGLGYYSRARNLKATAELIHTHYNDVFPSTYSEILKLKGVGPYTAAAIASFAFGEPCAVVDGNVIRVLSRIFGIEEPFDTGAGKKAFDEKATSLIDKKNPALYNQAIMDFGATVCVPKNPKCGSCPFSGACFAYQKEMIDALPFRSKKLTIKNRYFYFLHLENKSGVVLQQRTTKDIWQDLWQFPLIELAAPPKKGIKTELKKMLPVDTAYTIEDEWTHVQLLSHQKIHSRVLRISVPNLKSLLQENWQFVAKKKLDEFAFPKTLHLYLTEKKLI
ncbi:MAG: A/G-specific adenine glycosylase [Chitinophagales bacterium]